MFWQRRHLSNSRLSQRVPLLFMLSAVLFLTACSPRYDWREVQADVRAEVRAEGGAHWIASFPDRTQSQTRKVKLDSVERTMSMTAARVDTTSFAISEVELSPEARAEDIRDQMLQSMLRNIQSPAVQPDVMQSTIKNVSIARVETGRAPLAAHAVEADGRVGEQAVHLAGRFVAYPAVAGQPGRALQIIVLGPQEVLSRPAGQQAIETFMTSVRLE